MNDTEFLELHQRRLTRRLGRRSAAMNREVEKVVAPWMREHPRTGLATGAVAGLLLGAAVAPSSGAGTGCRGLISGSLRFLEGTAAYALRAKLVDSLAEGESED